MALIDVHYRLPSETDGLEVFGHYSMANCKLECALRRSAKRCRCIPWNYPRPIGGVEDICDQLGGWFVKVS